MSEYLNIVSTTVYRCLYCGIILWFLIGKGTALICYHCKSTESEDCGPIFKASSFEPETCYDNENYCAKQTQKAIRNVQLSAILRGCFKQSASIVKVNVTDGCQYWTNAKENFTAEYCFCKTDLCNRMSRMTSSLTLVVFVMMLQKQ